MTAEPNLLSSTIFAGRYQIETTLGEGDRKRTYLARDTKMDRLVALSIVKPEAAVLDPDGTEREAKVLGRIGSHDNIVSLYDYDIDPRSSTQYIVFEYLPGGTLAERLQESAPLPLSDILRFGRQLCRGLAHLHGRGLLHRDVSPGNVWLDERGEAHLGDFDSAVPIDSPETVRPLTTNAFASPEELGGGSLDRRSDLYSLGGVLYVLATGGTRPGDPASLCEERADLPSLFVDLVTALLSDAREDRPTNIESVIAELQAIRAASRIDLLLAAGESDTVEFKASLRHAYGALPPSIQKLPEEQQKSALWKELGKAVTKSIGAFLNSEGGSLVIGVDDAGNILGVEPDFAYLSGQGDLDKWFSMLKQLIMNAFGPEVWSVLRVSLVPTDQGTVALVSCPKRAIETWHRDGKDEDRFYVRAGNGTQELKGPDILKYVREHWAA